MKKSYWIFLMFIILNINISTAWGDGYPLPVFPIPIDGTKEQYVTGTDMYLNVNIPGIKGTITKTDFYNIPTMILKQVKMTFESPPQGTVCCYAGYLKEGDLYVAEKNLGGDVVFRRHLQGDTLKSYETYTFSDKVYCCTVFEKLDKIKSSVLLESNVIFACVVGNNNQGIVFGFNGAITKVSKKPKNSKKMTGEDLLLVFLKIAKSEGE